MSQRQQLAREFVLCWLAVCTMYGRRTYSDFRVLAARRRYLVCVARDCWKRAA